MSRPRLVHAPSLPVYDLGAEHPFARDRLRPLFDLIERHRWVDPEEWLRPAAADRAMLETAHDGAYIDAVAALSQDPPDSATLASATRWGLGTSDNPIAPAQHAAAAAVAGATAACVAEVMAGNAPAAFNPAGGLHHAMPAAASGFCIYNDLVVGIRHARQLGAERVLYVDFDVHHGDGVEFAFRADPSVMTVSFHETPEVRWPFTGRVHDIGTGAARGTSINMPLASLTGDDSWLEAVREVLPPAARRFRPDLIVSQHGCDPHRDDPLAALELTTGAMHEAARLTRELARELCDGRWVATGGGGYQPLTVTPRVWSVVWVIMSDRPLPDTIDPGWIEAWQPRLAPPLASRFVDAPHVNAGATAAAARNRDTIDQLTALLT